MLKPTLGVAYNIGVRRDCVFESIARDKNANLIFIFELPSPRGHFVISKDDWYSEEWQFIINLA